MGLPAIKLLRSSQEGPEQKRGKEGHSASIPPKEALNRVFPEPVFLHTLSLERKRAERSRKSFVLMLLDMEKVSREPNGNGSTILAKTTCGILSAIRETDSAGWFKAGRVLGIIFTELGTASRQSILEALNAKVTSVLSGTLGPGELGEIQLSFYCFPEDWKEKKPELGTDSPLYPDLLQLEKSRKIARVVKRAMDIAGSLLGLILLSPVFLAVSIAIKLTSRGPVLFRQERIGQYGSTFTFLKFRSMHCSNDPRIHMDYVKQFIAGKGDPAATDGNAKTVYKITRDPRVTPIGRFLRRTSLDELPQFFNVLKGEMSLVGPRPPLPYELDVYDVWHRRRLLEAKPGITGLWQVNGRSRLRFDDMVRLDLCYARTWSVWLDIKILLQTPRAVFSREGAY
jgi:lipopolysaccharide/colanic/teichoic acid biosynthesis glycosyltransferase